jgi:hypothetical protein
MTDITESLPPLLEKPIVLVDRMWISTLLYQGDGLQSVPEPFAFERVALSRFEQLFTELKIDLSKIYTIIFRYPFGLSEKAKLESNPAKVILDQRLWHYARKLTTLINNSDTCPQLKSPLWLGTHYITEPSIEKHAKVQEPVDTSVIAHVQESRMQLISSLLGLVAEAPPAASSSTP